MSYEFSLFNTSENHKSQTVRALGVPSIGTPCGNHVLPSVRFGAKKREIKVGLPLFWRFGGVMAKTGQTLPTSFFVQLYKFQNFTNSETRYLEGVPLDLTQKAKIVREL